MTKKWRAPWLLAAVAFCLTAMGCEQKIVEEKSVKPIEAAPAMEKSAAPASESAPPTAPEASSADRAAPSGK